MSYKYEFCEIHAFHFLYFSWLCFEKNTLNIYFSTLDFAFASCPDFLEAVGPPGRGPPWVPLVLPDSGHTPCWRTANIAVGGQCYHSQPPLLKLAAVTSTSKACLANNVDVAMPGRRCHQRSTHGIDHCTTNTERKEKTQISKI